MHDTTFPAAQAANISTARRHDAPLGARTYSTDQAAAALHVRPQTLRAALCRDGAYYGVRPVKRITHMLAWPADAIDALARGEAA